MTSDDRDVGDGFFRLPPRARARAYRGTGKSVTIVTIVTATSTHPFDDRSRDQAARLFCYIVGREVDAPGTDPVRCLRQQEGVDPPRKPLPRKKIPADLKSLARAHTELAIKVLAGMLSQEAVPAAARVSAAGILLDRGWGRPPQVHTGEHGNDIKVTIRQIVERRDED